MIVVVTDGGLLRPEGGAVDVSDLTAAVRTGEPRWVAENTLDLPFDPEPSAAEQTLIRRRLMTTDPAHEAWVGQVVAARAASDTTALVLLLADRALMGIDSPTLEA